MGLYLFQHPETKEVKEIYQGMNDTHTYEELDTVWNRVFTKPQAAFNTCISASDAKSFVDKTRGKNYSLGQLWDMSAELSGKRGGTTGEDEVRIKAENAYEKKTTKKHPHAKRKTNFQV